MDRIRKALKERRPPSPSYEPLQAASTKQLSSLTHCPRNMYLAASPYFQHRFSSSAYLFTNFPAYLSSIATITNLASVTLLTRLQRSASYPRRIIASLCLNLVGFTLLAISTVLFRSISAQGYFGFLMVMVFTTSLASGLCQNGVFAYVSGFGVPTYTQAIMTGQAVAGVLPCIAEIVSVLSVPEDEAPQAGAAQQSSKSALAYFLTATAVSVATLLAFFYLLKSHKDANIRTESAVGLENALEEEQSGRKVVSLWTLFKKLRFLSMAVFLCFAVTMFTPIFTQKILSVRPQDTATRLFEPDCFIPLGFLVWNAGDLIGRLLTGIQLLSLVHRPRILFALSILRLILVPLYLLCNIRDRGPVINSDIFYLVGVQLVLGLLTGYIGSSCMMGAGDWVEKEEREAAGGFMGLMLVGGLAVGSLLSFLAA
ncbi:MAG: hypothetical protein Q9223_004027 [Gallowayella weberi]